MPAWPLKPSLAGNLSSAAMGGSPRLAVWWLTAELIGYPHWVTTDEEVLAYIGVEGRSYRDLAQRFPAFDMARLVRAQLVESALEEPTTETEAHALDAKVAALRYVLTPRGAKALGISNDPLRA